MSTFSMYINSFKVFISVQESLQARVPPLHGSAVPLSVGSKQPVLENISPISRVQGMPDTSELVRTLPQKYRRKTMSDEEMEFIQVSLIFVIIYLVCAIFFKMMGSHDLRIT